MNDQLYIFVMERGFVLVGTCTQSKEDYLFWTLTQCGSVRRWGTTKGLGQLANEGPKSETIIDAEPDGTEISKKATYRRIPCNMKAWAKYLKNKE